MTRTRITWTPRRAHVSGSYRNNATKVYSSPEGKTETKMRLKTSRAGETVGAYFLQANSTHPSSDIHLSPGVTRPIYLNLMCQ